MSEIEKHGCLYLVYGSLGVLAAFFIYVAYDQTTEIMEGNANNARAIEVVATPIIDAIANTPVPHLEPAAPPVGGDVQRQSPEEIKARLEAYPYGAQLVVVREDGTQFLVEKERGYYKIIQWLNREPGWADRVLTRDIIYVQ